MILIWRHALRGWRTSDEVYEYRIVSQAKGYGRPAFILWARRPGGRWIKIDWSYSCREVKREAFAWAREAAARW